MSNGTKPNLTARAAAYGLIFATTLWPGVSAAQTRVWTGAVNDSWCEPGNWSPKGIPSFGAIFDSVGGDVFLCDNLVSYNLLVRHTEVIIHAGEYEFHAPWPTVQDVSGGSASLEILGSSDQIQVGPFYLPGAPNASASLTVVAPNGTMFLSSLPTTPQATASLTVRGGEVRYGADLLEIGRLGGSAVVLFTDSCRLHPYDNGGSFPIFIGEDASCQ